MTELVAADIGGTHARFALAEVSEDRVVSLGTPLVLDTADYAGLDGAWRRFGAVIGRPLPRAAALAIASPIGGKELKFTNSPWVIRPALLHEQLGLNVSLLVNDFGAVSHAVAQASAEQFAPICGPDEPLPARGVVTVCGPGTGLGVAQLLRTDDGYHVLETEGGHMDFAPLDAFEDRLVARLRERFGRVSAERVCAGPGIVAIYETLAEIEDRSRGALDDRAIWAAALAGSDPLAVAALDRFYRALGAVAGNLALAQGATAVVLAGGLGLRLKNHLPRSGFTRRFVAKGRFREKMTRIPVKLITMPEPGLFGAAAAFAQRHSAR